GVRRSARAQADSRVVVRRRRRNRAHAGRLLRLVLARPAVAVLMLTGRDIVCISSVDWDFHWQIHHEIMSTLAAQGNRVLYIENTGVRSPGVGDVARVRQRVRNWWRSTKGFRQQRDN